MPEDQAAAVEDKQVTSEKSQAPISTDLPPSTVESGSNELPGLGLGNFEDNQRLLRKRKSLTEDSEDIVVTRSRRHGSRQTNHAPPSPRAVLKELQHDTESHGLGHEVDGSASVRPVRSIRLKIAPPKPRGAKLGKMIKGRTAILEVRVDPRRLRQILTLKSLKKKSLRRESIVPPSAIIPSFTPTSFSQPFYAFHDRELDETKSKPYGGILNEADADTTLTLPKNEHRRQFDEARQKAEQDRETRLAEALESASISGVTRPRKVSGPASQIEYIEFGEFQIDVWYAAPYPEEYSRNKALFICEFCLKYMESDIVAWRHKTKCPWKHPPGDEIYREGKISMFEVDGRKNPLYCQNLCLLAKLFLGSKTLYYDVEPFLFYVMTEYDRFGCHFVGYFSKEKRPSSTNNVSCILVLPIHQRKGYGHLLMDFSYLLTRVEKKTGSPEKPLSDMGLVSYRNYWRLVLCYYLRDFKSQDLVPSVKTISDDTGLTPDDVVSTLEGLRVLVRDPMTGCYAAHITPDYYDSVIRLHESKGWPSLTPNKLVWTPYVMGRGNLSAFDLAPPIHAVAQRDDDGDMSPTQQGDSNISRPSIEQDTDSTDGTNSTSHTAGNLLTSITNGHGGSKSRVKMYFDASSNIPASRFEIFPPPPGTKKASARTSSRHARPRPVATGSRSAARRSAPSRTPSNNRSRPRSSSARRTGGTGRGPGRWPKGTKKSDYGDAESGPGLPPRLVAGRSRLGNEVVMDADVYETTPLEPGMDADGQLEDVDEPDEAVADDEDYEERSVTAGLEDVDDVDVDDERSLDDVSDQDTPAPRTRRSERGKGNTFDRLENGKSTDEDLLALDADGETE